ncbi:hypothetical protein ACFLYG_01545 [Chloroflexota bacterium]
MLLCGHIGITAGVVKAYDILVSMPEPDNISPLDSGLKFGTVIGRGRLRLHYLISGIQGRIGSIDYRKVLHWPLLGTLPKKETVVWLSKVVQKLFSHPEVYVPEIIGLVIVLLFVYRLVMGKSAISFLKDGTIG